VTRSRTARALASVARPLRHRVACIGGVGALAGLAAVLALAAWSARVGMLRSPFWVPAAWGLGLLAAVLAGALAFRAGLGFRAMPFAIRLERDSGWRSGALSGLLEPAVSATSLDLHAAADQQAAELLVARAPDALGPQAARLLRLLGIAAAALAGSVLLLGAAGLRHGRAALLWQPRRALDMVASPLRIVPELRTVSAGDSVALRITAPGRQSVTLWTRAPGTTWEAALVTLDSLGQARRMSGPLAQALYAHVTAGRKSSDTIEVAVRRPAFLASLALTIHYPAYLKLEDEPAAAGGDTLLLPAGSRIEAHGEATVSLGAARWERDGVRAALRLDGARFAGTLLPASSGGYRLVLETSEGIRLSGEAILLAVRLLPDLPPVVEIPVPSGDTVAPPTGSLPLVIDARDDHGLSDVVLERRVTHAGRVRPLPEEPLGLPGQAPDRAILPAAIDAALLHLVPGDTLRVAARARDNSPSHQVGRSREIAITLPTRPELRAEERDRAAAIARQLDSLVKESREAQRQSEDLGRAEQRGTERALDFDAAKKAEAVADRQGELLKQAEAAQRALSELRKAAERAGLNDSVFQQRLREVQEQLDRALSPELRRQLAELQEALKALDRERTRDAVRQLGDAQQKLREALERSRELFKRAALEGELASLEQESKELAQDQRAWNEKVPATDSAQAAAQERQLGQRADSLAAALRQTAKQLEAQQRREALSEAADTAKAAAEQMRQAQNAAAKSQPAQAQRSGEKAAGAISKAQQQVQEQREAQQQEWREEIVAQLDRALLETTRLAERQLGIAEQFRRSASLGAARSAQGALEEGVQKLIEQVGSASGKNALVSPQILAALAEARAEMQKAREGAASASGNARESAERAGDAVDALNVAAYGLLRSREDVAGAGSGSGFAEAMERMTRLAKQQGQLSQDASGLLPMMGSTAMQQQLQSLAARQRALAQELERLRAQGQADAKPLGDEARDLARELERGRLDRETVTRQERLFRRMLDAGRTLQGKEEDEQKERQSETAKGELQLPPALRAQLLGKDGIRLPTWEQLQRLSPEERRLVTDYFRRITGGVP
jgi:hypothetical protein